MADSLTERVRARLCELSDARRFSRQIVAERLGVSPSAVSQMVRRNHSITLGFLEVVADEAQIPVAELVADPKAVLKELNADEAAILRALRKWPTSVTRDLAAFLAFFADEESALTQTRNLHAYWRGMAPKDREWFYGIAVLLREHMLSPEIRARLMDRVEAELQARAMRRGGSERTPP